MKWVYKVLLLFALIGFLSGCQSSEDDTDFDTKLLEVKTILTMGGYYMEEVGAASAFTFINDNINKKFDLELDFYQLYIGEQEGYDDVYLIVFWEVSDAELYEEAIIEHPELEDRSFHREGHVVVLTYSEDAMDLLE